MPVIELLSTPVFNAITWALLYSLWQAAIIYALTWILLHVNKDAPAHLKHNLAAGAQLVIAIWFVVTFIQHLQIGVATKEAIESARTAMLISPIQLPLMGNMYEVTEASPIILNVDALLPIFLLLYLAGLIFMGWRMIIGYQHTRILKHQGITNVSHELLQVLEKIKASLRVNQKVRLYISGMVNSPILIGFLKPVILLPLSIFTQLSPEQLRAILIHEMAHIRRMDYLVNYLQAFLEAILFFNPFVWLLSKIMREQREIACDDWVVREISPQSYASALLALEVARKEATMAMAAKRKGQYPLLNRIKAFSMSPNNKSTKINFKQKMVSVLLILISISCLAWLAPSKSKNTDAQSHAVTSSPSVQKDTSRKDIVVTRPDIQKTPTSHRAAATPNDDNSSDTSILSPKFQEQLKKIQEAAMSISSKFEHNADWDKAMQAFQEKAKTMGESFKMDPKMEEKLNQLGQQAQSIAQQTVNSPEFQQQLKTLQQEAAKIKERAAADSSWSNEKGRIAVEKFKQIAENFKQDPEWQSRLRKIQEQAKDISSKFANNPEWDKHVKELAAQASELTKSLFESPEFKKQIEEIKQQAAQLKLEAERQKGELH